mgnify:CR=1 FL=1
MKGEKKESVKGGKPAGTGSNPPGSGGGKEKTEVKTEKLAETQKTQNGILQLVLARLENIGVTENEILDINNTVVECEKLSTQIQELVAKRQELMKKLYSFMEKLDDSGKQLLQFLGLVDVERIRKLMKAETPKAKKKAGRRQGKKIIVDGVEYSSAKAACESLEIEVGGDSPVRKLVSFAKSNDYRIFIDGEEMPKEMTLSEIYAKLGNASEIKIQSV